jgi:hypothetical protein
LLKTGQGHAGLLLLPISVFHLLPGTILVEEREHTMYSTEDEQKGETDIYSRSWAAQSG